MKLDHQVDSGVYLSYKNQCSLPVCLLLTHSCITCSGFVDGTPAYCQTGRSVPADAADNLFIWLELWMLGQSCVLRVPLILQYSAKHGDDE